MKVTNPPQKLIDESDGQPVEEINPDGSRFEKIAVKELDDGVEVRARERGTDEVTAFVAESTDELYGGVSVEGTDRRRDIDDDVQDALQLVGYTLVDESVKAY